MILTSQDSGIVATHYHCLKCDYHFTRVTDDDTKEHSDCVNGHGFMERSTLEPQPYGPVDSIWKKLKRCFKKDTPNNE